MKKIGRKNANVEHRGQNHGKKTCFIWGRKNRRKIRWR